MLNRRQLRIKILHILYAYYIDEEPDMGAYEKQLYTSIEKDYELYLYFLSLVSEMQFRAIDKIEAGLQKKLPTKEDLHPNTKFVTNAPLRVMKNSKVLEEACKEQAVSWNGHEDVLKAIFNALIETEDYKEYMASEERGHEHDRTYLLRFFKKHLINEQVLHDWLEERSIFWNDDVDIIASMVLKTIKLIDEDAKDMTLLPLWRDEKDEKHFVDTVYRKTLALGEEHGKLIAEHASNWDMDRIALMDLILMKMALAEARHLETIPLKVTLNEYIELAKYYSTPKSSGFINGVLDQLFTKLNDAGEIKKLGRGMIQG